jgi:hypothetical protein
MPSEAAVIMVTVTLAVSVFSAAKIRDGVKELRAIQQFGCQTVQNVAFAANNYNFSPPLFSNCVGFLLSLHKSKSRQWES